MTKRYPATFIASLALLAGCAGQQTRSLPTDALICDASMAPDQMSPDCTRRIAGVAALAYQSGWTMLGRVAISNGEQGGNARVEWIERGLRDYSVTLSAPVTRQSWRLDVANGQAVISGIEGGPRSSPDAALLLRQATNWDIPVDSLRWWVRGQTAPMPPATRYVFTADGALFGLDQDGWRIQFERTGDEILPKRITATRGDSRVRLVIDQWDDVARE